jgi:hypothetical protein
MLREHINDIMTRWNPKQRRTGAYDPGLFLESPEQARKLIEHLTKELDRARRARNTELIDEVLETLEKVENLSKKFFRWEQTISRNLETDDLREIKKLPLNF